jgi:hypothetical protein
MSRKFFRYEVCLSITFCLLTACSLNNYKSKSQGGIEAAWLNPLIFEQQIKTDGYLSDIQFNIEFTGADEKPFFAKECSFVLQNSNGVVMEQEYHRWQWLKDNCIAAKKYFDAPKTAYSFWAKIFDYETIKHFPAAAIPDLGGESLEGRIGTLSAYETSLTFVEASGENCILVEVDNLVVYYSQVARADFNRDGYQDVFIRMDWYVEDAFGKGTDWVVLTKLSPKDEPMMLWRK